MYFVLLELFLFGGFVFFVVLYFEFGWVMVIVLLLLIVGVVFGIDDVVFDVVIELFWLVFLVEVIDDIVGV